MTPFHLFHPFLFRRKFSLSSMVVAFLLLVGTSSASAQQEAWTAALRNESADALSLVWRQGKAIDPHVELRIDKGAAALFRCDKECVPVGSQTALTPGQKEQLLSGLRALRPTELRSSDEPEQADREIHVFVPAYKPVRLALSVGDFPADASGESLAVTLDEQIRKLFAQSQARPKVTFPHSVAELDELRLLFVVTANQKPGGTLLLEHGVLTITPEEGSIPRKPRKKTEKTTLTENQKGELVKVLSPLDFDQLERAIPQRAEPAIGDTDARVIALHLQTASAVPPKNNEVKKPVPPSPSLKQPRGLRRYAADVVRSPAAQAVALLGQYLSLNLAP